VNRIRSESPAGPPSKSQLKREARALFDLGRQLAGLDPAVLETLPLEERLRQAVAAARRMRAHGARKRQLQFIAKLLRNMDAEPVREAVEALNEAARRQAVGHHRVEAWRDRLLATGDRAVTELVANHPCANPQILRQLLRTARREAGSQAPPAATRKLFRLLRDMDEAEPLPPPEAD
jgi:ribosome-associated protein